MSSEGNNGSQQVGIHGPFAVASSDFFDKALQNLSPSTINTTSDNQHLHQHQLRPANNDPSGFFSSNPNSGQVSLSTSQQHTQDSPNNLSSQQQQQLRNISSVVGPFLPQQQQLPHGGNPQLILLASSQHSTATPPTANHTNNVTPMMTNPHLQQIQHSQQPPLAAIHGTNVLSLSQQSHHSNSNASSPNNASQPVMTQHYNYPQAGRASQHQLQQQHVGGGGSGNGVVGADRTNSLNLSTSDNARCNIFVAGLDRTIGDKLLFELFNKFGEVLSCKVMLDIVTGQSRGFGFVLYSDSASAEKAIKLLDGHTIYLKKVFSSSSSSPSSSTTPAATATATATATVAPSSSVPPDASLQQSSPSEATTSGGGDKSPKTTDAVNVTNASCVSSWDLDHNSSRKILGGGGAGSGSGSNAGSTNTCFLPVRLQVQYSSHRGENLLCESPNVRVRNIPDSVTDADLVAWLKENHRVTVHSVQNAQELVGSNNNNNNNNNNNTNINTNTNNLGSKHNNSNISSNSNAQQQHQPQSPHDASVGNEGSVSSDNNATATNSLNATPETRSRATSYAHENAIVNAAGTESPTSAPSISLGSNAQLNTSQSGTRRVVLTCSSPEAARICVNALHGKKVWPACTVPLLAKVEEPHSLRLQRLKTLKKEQQHQNNQQQQQQQQQPPQHLLAPQQQQQQQQQFNQQFGQQQAQAQPQQQQQHYQLPLQQYPLHHHHHHHHQHHQFLPHHQFAHPQSILVGAGSGMSTPHHHLQHQAHFGFPHHHQHQHQHQQHHQILNFSPSAIVPGVHTVAMGGGAAAHHPPFLSTAAGGSAISPSTSLQGSLNFLGGNPLLSGSQGATGQHFTITPPTTSIGTSPGGNQQQQQQSPPGYLQQQPQQQQPLFFAAPPTFTLPGGGVGVGGQWQQFIPVSASSNSSNTFIGAGATMNTQSPTVSNGGVAVSAGSSSGPFTLNAQGQLVDSRGMIVQILPYQQPQQHQHGQGQPQQIPQFFVQQQQQQQQQSPPQQQQASHQQQQFYRR